MDAAPLVGSAGSYGLVRDLIQEGLLSDIEVNMWLASLAFQTKPTLEMITIVSVSLSSSTSMARYITLLFQTAHSRRESRPIEGFAVHLGHDTRLLQTERGRLRE